MYKNCLFTVLFLGSVSINMSYAQSNSNAPNSNAGMGVSPNRDNNINRTYNTPAIRIENTSYNRNENASHTSLTERRNSELAGESRYTNNGTYYDYRDATSGNRNTTSSSSYRLSKSPSGAGSAGVSSNTGNSNNNQLMTGNRLSGAAGYSYSGNNGQQYNPAQISRYKSQKHNSDSVRIHCRMPLADWVQYGNCQCNARLPFFYGTMLLCNKYYSNLIYFNETDLTFIPNQLPSFDGYIVYGNDTLNGVITMDKKEANIQPPADANRKYISTAKFKDQNLKGIVLFSGNMELHLTRLNSGDKKLYRVLHTGKLNIYDDRTTRFPSIKNVHTSSLQVAFSGEESYYKVIDRNQLVSYINKAYDLNLNADNYTWASLLMYIDKLN